MPEPANASAGRVARAAAVSLLSKSPPRTKFFVVFIRPLWACLWGLNMEMMPEFSVDNVKNQIADTLRLFVGHGRRLSWSDLSVATGDKERKLRSYVEPGGPEMPLDVFMRVFAVLPPEAFARVARYMGFSAAPCEVDDGATIRSGVAKAARLVADYNEFQEDGTLSHIERSKLADRAAALLPDLQSIAGNGSTH